jgi:hypothetical protein
MEILESLYKNGKGSAEISDYRSGKMFQILLHMADYQVVQVYRSTRAYMKSMVALCGSE